MKFIFWFFLSLITFIYFGYPVILFVISLLDGKKFKKEQILPNVTILIPAHNEEKVISKKLENCFSLDYPQDKLEVILILDACTDNTESIVLSHKGTGLRIIKQKERKGKIAALNKAASKAKGEILIFTDANSIYNRQAIKKLTSHFSDSKIGCVCGELKYIYDKKEQETEENIYWRYEQFLKEKESKLGSLLITNGSIYGIRKELFSPINEDLADDFVNPIRIKSKGFNAIYEPGAVATELAAGIFKEEFSRKVRIISQGFKGSRRLFSDIVKCGPLFVFEFLFHKFLRWLVGLFLIFIFVSNVYIADKPFYVLILILQILFYFAALLGYVKAKQKRQNKFLGFIFYFCIVNLAAMIGLFKVLVGTQTATWEIAKTTR